MRDCSLSDVACIALHHQASSGPTTCDKSCHRHMQTRASAGSWTFSYILHSVCKVTNASTNRKQPWDRNRPWCSKADTSKVKHSHLPRKKGEGESLSVFALRLSIYAMLSSFFGGLWFERTTLLRTLPIGKHCSHISLE